MLGFAYLRVWRPTAAHAVAARIAVAALCLTPIASAVNKLKLHGYITRRADATAVMILDDRIELSAASRVFAKDEAGEHSFKAEDLAPGMLVEAEGQWLDRHKFFAEKIIVDFREDEKRVRGTAYLQEEPGDAGKIASGEPSEAGPQTCRQNPASSSSRPALSRP